MAKESSFDVVSDVDMQEVDNAYQQARRELAQRYDLKGTGASVEMDRDSGTFVVRAPADFVARQVIDLLGGKLVRRGVDLKSVSWGDPEAASGGTVRVTGALVRGIPADTAKRIAKDIRDQKLKAKATIEGDKLRVSSASKDVLQQVIRFLRAQDYDLPLQFENYR